MSSCTLHKNNYYTQTTGYSRECDECHVDIVIEIRINKEQRRKIR